MSGEAFGTNSRFHPGRAEECETTMTFRLGDLPGSSVLSLDVMRRMTGLDDDQIMSGIEGLEQRGLIQWVNR